MKNWIHGLNIFTTLMALQLPYLSAHGQKVDTRPKTEKTRPFNHGAMTPMMGPLKENGDREAKIESLRLFKQIQSDGLKIQIFEGGVGTGGGDFVSQEVRSIVSDLPSILVAKGLQYFPEVDIDELEKESKSFVQVKLVGRILVDGSPKAMFFDQKEKLINVDPLQWAGIGDDESAKLKKQALVLHEVLGLMGLEKNNDYSISNRLLGLHFLQALNIMKFSNQIVPRDHLNPQVIYWRKSSSGRITIFHCSDRKVVSTCRMLGNRSYTQSELQQAFVDLKKKHMDDLQQLDNTRKNWKTTSLVLLAVFVIIVAIAGAPVAAIAALATPAVQIASAFSILFSLGAGVSWERSNNKIELAKFNQSEKESAAQRIADQKPGSADYENFDLYAKNLNEFLINQSPIASSEPSKVTMP